MGKKIALLSVFDFCGSGYRIAEAVNLNSNNFVEYFVMLPVLGKLQFKRYPPIFRMEGTATITNDDIERINYILYDCDVIHLKTDYPLSHDVFKAFTFPQKIPLVHTVCGSGFRNLKKQYPERIQEYVDMSDFRTAINPDLNYPEYWGIYTPFAYDCNNIKNVWKKKEIPIIAHSPSSRKKKGTDIFLKACDILKDKGIKFEVNLIENLQHLDCLDEKSDAVIVFDQINAGSYGNSAVESMAMGIPTLCHISDEAHRQSNGRLDNCPIIECGTTIKSMVKTIEKLLSSDLERISKETYKWCKKEHSYESIGRMWSDIYDKV